jgi:hypothetical protein
LFIGSVDLAQAAAGSSSRLGDHISSVLLSEQVFLRQEITAIHNRLTNENKSIQQKAKFQKHDDRNSHPGQNMKLELSSHGKFLEVLLCSPASK